MKDEFLLIPSSPVLRNEVERGDVDDFQCKRDKVIRFLRRIPAVWEAVKNVGGKEIYRIHIPADVRQMLKKGTARLTRRKQTGYFGATIVNSKGKVICHIAHEKIGSEISTSLNQLAIQQSFTEVLHQLDAISDKVDFVLKGQHYDRLADVKTGVALYEQAMAVADRTIQRSLLMSAIEKLTDGRNKLLLSLDLDFIDKLPKTQLKMFLSKHANLPQEVKRNAEAIWRSAIAVVTASQYLALSYSFINEDKALRVSLQQCKAECLELETRIQRLVNWLPPDDRLRQEMLEIGAMVTSVACEAIEYNNKALTLEFSVNEILN